MAIDPHPALSHNGLMPQNRDFSTPLQESIRAANAERRALAIHGGGSKRVLTGDIPGDPLDVTRHCGVVSYEPTELVITARAGTPLAEIESTLAASNQMLGFEPPHFGGQATLGGTLACGLSGPRRPYAGSARDFTLGATIINGQGELLRFGGQVMKNVAGYDVSRLMVGARGTLGVLLDLSLKVLPRPETEITLAFEMAASDAITSMNRWAAQPLPLSAACHQGETLHLRLSGSAAGVRAARAKLGGEPITEGESFWEKIREHRHGFFLDTAPLWRMSVPPATDMLAIGGKTLLDWGGAQRWVKSSAPAVEITQAASAAGGYALPYHAQGRCDVGRESGMVENISAELRKSFDPHRILNAALA